jgi:hypothetical protein
MLPIQPRCLLYMRLQTTKLNISKGTLQDPTPGTHRLLGPTLFLHRTTAYITLDLNPQVILYVFAWFFFIFTSSCTIWGMVEGASLNTGPPNSHLLFPTSHLTIYIPKFMSRDFKWMCYCFSRMTSNVSSQGTISVICSAYVEYLLSFLSAQHTSKTVLSISPHFNSVFVRYLDKKDTGLGYPLIPVSSPLTLSFL